MLDRLHCQWRHENDEEKECHDGKPTSQPKDPNCLPRGRCYFIAITF